MDRSQAYAEMPLWNLRANPDVDSENGIPNEGFWKDVPLMKQLKDAMTHVGLFLKAHCPWVNREERTRATAVRALISLESQLSAFDHMFASQRERVVDANLDDDVKPWNQAYQAAKLDTPVNNPLDLSSRKLVQNARVLAPNSDYVDGTFILSLFQAKPVSNNAASDLARAVEGSFAKAKDATGNERFSCTKVTEASEKADLLKAVEGKGVDGVKALRELRESIRSLKDRGFSAACSGAEADVAEKAKNFIAALADFRDTAQKQLGNHVTLKVTCSRV